MLNYLARLGWSHGDEELFSRAQLVEWFDGSHLARQPGAVGRGQARLGQRALPEGAGRRGAARAGARAAARGAASMAPADERAAARRCALFKDRCSDRRRAGRLAGDVFVPVDAERGGRGRARHRRGAARRSRRCAGKLADGRVGQGRDRRGDQGDARRARPEDAAARAWRCACSSAAARRRRRSTRCSRCSRARRCWRVCGGAAQELAIISVFA